MSNIPRDFSMFLGQYFARANTVMQIAQKHLKTDIHKRKKRHSKAQATWQDKLLLNPHTDSPVIHARRFICLRWRYRRPDEGIIKEIRVVFNWWQILIVTAISWRETPWPDDAGDRASDWPTDTTVSWDLTERQILVERLRGWHWLADAWFLSS